MRQMLLVAAVLACPAAAPAQTPPAPAPWANKLFMKDILQNPAQPAVPVVEWNFGEVPQGTLCVHKFSVTNIYDVPIQVVEVRKSCTCLDYVAPPGPIPPNETAEFTVSMNSAKFTGQNAQTFYVTFGPKYVSTAVVRVSANSNALVSVNPGVVNFGSVALGAKATQAVSVKYNGKARDWKLEAVPPGGPLDVQVTELSRGRLLGGAEYRVDVSLKADAAAGGLNDTITLKTTDPAHPFVQITVAGTVQAPLVAEPNRVRLDRVEVGQTASQRVLLRAARPFRVLAAEGTGNGLEVDLPAAGVALPVQTVTVRFAPSALGTQAKSVRLRTDLDGGTVVTLPVQAEGVPASSDEPKP